MKLYDCRASFIKVVVFIYVYCKECEFSDGGTTSLRLVLTPESGTTSLQMREYCMVQFPTSQWEYVLGEWVDAELQYVSVAT